MLVRARPEELTNVNQLQYYQSQEGRNPKPMCRDFQVHLQNRVQMKIPALTLSSARKTRKKLVASYGNFLWTLGLYEK